jgi:hypothetical protein
MPGSLIYANHFVSPSSPARAVLQLLHLQYGNTRYAGKGPNRQIESLNLRHDVSHVRLCSQPPLLQLGGDVCLHAACWWANTHTVTVCWHTLLGLAVIQFRLYSRPWRPTAALPRGCRAAQENPYLVCTAIHPVEGAPAPSQLAIAVQGWEVRQCGSCIKAVYDEG